MKAIEIGKRLLEGPVEPMSRTAAETFIMLTAGRYSGTPFKFPENLTYLPQGTVILKQRLEYHGVKAEDDAILFLSSLVTTPGQAVLMCAVLKALEEKHGRPTDITDLGKDFPMGFPTEVSMRDAWLAQKGKAGENVDNWLDKKEAWVTLN